ncbi:DsbA family protein [Staphylococcus sp. SQ8-PEA]|uniref:DsbA family protein n=1 Tax=Staphylococcus marylandisciuri TaxID=2981529 RepID=A0ABT2QMS5_9STAP|nr:DsbA family protein [Staphylococcus marylandisciuri]MCU5745291.1 DsbA family protein [Staphylococcus marylandisciuri]
MNKYINIMSIICCVILLVSCAKENEHQSKVYEPQSGKVKVVEYGDLKCSYCKKLDEKVMPKLQSKYLSSKDVEYQFVNMAFLDKDSLVGSRAEHAVKLIAPKQHLKFIHRLYQQQPKDGGHWLTHKLIDKEISRLDISTTKKKEIKKAYKNRNSQAWKDAKKDQERYKKENIKQAPTVFINGKKVDDPYDFNSYEQQIDKIISK